MGGARQPGVARAVERVVLEVDGHAAGGLRHEARERAGELSAERAQEVRVLDDLHRRGGRPLRRDPLEVDGDDVGGVVGALGLLGEVGVELPRVVERRLEVLRALLPVLRVLRAGRGFRRGRSRSRLAAGRGGRGARGGGRHGRGRRRRRAEQRRLPPRGARLECRVDAQDGPRHGEAPEHPAGEREAALRASGRGARAAEGGPGGKQGEERGRAQAVGQDAQRAVRADREGLHAEEQEVHQQPEGEGGGGEAGQGVEQVGGGEERQGQEEREREVEGEAVRRDGEPGEGRPRAAGDVLAAARLAVPVPAGLVHRGDGPGLPVVLPEENAGHGRSGEAQAQRDHDPRPSARSHFDLPK